MSERRPILLFDVMDTLVHDPFFHEVLDHLGMTKKELLAVKNKDAWFDFEAARIDEATYLARFFQDGRSLDGDALKGCLRRSFRWLDGMQELLAELRGAGYEIHALSNYPSWYQLIEAELGLSRYLEWTFVSWHTGIRKPDPEAYLGVPRSTGAAIADHLFIDDRTINTDAARAAGMDAILFRSASDLRRELEARSLL